METKIKIGEKIRLLRRKNDVTQDALAGHLGVTPQAVSRWESGICYPDMNVLPDIADYFSVSMDELLCYNNTQKEARVQDYIDKADRLLDHDRIPEALELLRHAMADIPSDDALRLESAGVLSLYAERLSESGSGDERVHAAVQAALSEAVSLCRHILDDSTDDRLRDETKKTLCDIYAHQVGDDQQAQEIASQLHTMSCSQEIIRATVLTGETAFLQAEQNLILFADNIWWHLYNLACVPDISGNRYTVAEQIALLQKGVDIFNILFGETPLFYADRLANSYRQMAMLCLTLGKNEDALTCFERMADYAVAFDERPDEAVYPSLGLDHIVYRREDDTEFRNIGKCARLLKGQFSARIWNPIRSDRRFREAVTRMEACADAHMELSDDIEETPETAG